MHYLRYRSNMTCLESCSVCAFTPITLAACRHDSNSHDHSTHTISSDLTPAIAILQRPGGMLPFTLPTSNLWVPHYFVADRTFSRTAFTHIHTHTNLVSDVDLGEAESLQVDAGGPDGRSDSLHQQLLQILADEGPSLLDDLHNTTRIQQMPLPTIYLSLLKLTYHLSQDIYIKQKNLK